jgi:DNA-directed RNA polymerase subunit RPC12/RpoP
MENCAKCEKELLWNEQKMVFWNKQLKKGYIRWMAFGSPYFGKERKIPKYEGKKLCQNCAIDVFEEAMSQTPALQIKGEDFADLKKSFTESGISITAFNCSKCDKMNDIPETGKLLICKHCGNPIKPKDIHEKIKELTE